MSGSIVRRVVSRYQVWRPPYCYRWSALIAVVTMIVWLTAWAVQPDAGSSAAGSPASQAPPATGRAPTLPAAMPGLVTSAAGDGKVVALTFDDGPHPQYTPQVLALLAQHRAVATFCMVGYQAARYPELVRQVAAAGMRLCAHSMSHDEQLPTRPASSIEAEIVGSRAVLVAAAGPDTAVDHFRAPAGNWSEHVQLVATHGNMKSLSWSVDSHDWTQPGAAQILATVQRDVQPGAVVLLHDGGGRREQTIAALTELLPWLVAQGYTFGVPA